MRVRDVYNKITGRPDTVTQDRPIDGVIEDLARNPATRAVYVVDANGALAGIITAKILISILGVRYIRTDTITVLKDMMASSAEDIMVDPVSVTLDEPLTESLRKMVRSQLEDLPVVDEEGRVIGDLNCFELIQGLQQQGAGSGG